MTRLGRKQTTTQQTWLDALKNIGEQIPMETLRKQIQKTTAEIERVCDGLNVGYAWSGGKDSLVLQRLMEASGISKCVWGASYLEYPELELWIDRNRPSPLKVYRRPLDLKWLAEHPAFLFPRSSTQTYKWFKLIQHKAQSLFFEGEGLDILVLGRRTKDGNYTGAKGKDIYTNNAGVTRYSPMADWTHEMVLAFIYHMGIDLPPNYYWKDGFKIGTGPWAKRPFTGSVNQDWADVYGIDPSIVQYAATEFRSAQAFLETV